MAKPPVSRPLLDWLLSRGSHTMAVQLHSTGAGYQVSVHPIELTLAGRETREFTTLCDAASHAFRLHAAWVASFRDAGWTSVAYR